MSFTQQSHLAKIITLSRPLSRGMRIAEVRILEKNGTMTPRKETINIEIFSENLQEGDCVTICNDNFKWVELIQLKPTIH